MSNVLSERKEIRLKGYNYSRNGVYFVTICVKDKKKLLGEIDNVVNIAIDKAVVRLSKIGQEVQRGIEKIGEIYQGVEVEKYVVMPNHVHLLLTLHGEKFERNNRKGKIVKVGCDSFTNKQLATIIRSFKLETTRIYGQQFWQRSYYDHVVRDERDYVNVWQYIEYNPQRWVVDKYYAR